MSATNCAGLRWVAPKEAAVAAGVTPGVVWRWCRDGLVRVRRLPGRRRGRLRVALDGDGLPLQLHP